jgi:2-polyprenyl-3-methyl-5-hydroxy-6-metoxy-1,4-benzoquinol methylase
MFVRRLLQIRAVRDPSRVRRDALIDPTAGAAINVHEIVAALLDPPSQLPVLDVGAGTGNFTAYLTSCGYETIAVDIDPVDYRNAGYCGAPFIEANLDEELPVPLESASGCVAIEVLEHLEGPLLTLRRMAGAVTIGGFVIVTTPNIMSWTSRLELVVRGHHELFGNYEYETNGHISPLSLTEIVRMGDRLALRPEAVTYNVGRLPIPRLHRYPLTAAGFRVQALGECLIVKFRKTGPVLSDYERG